MASDIYFKLRGEFTPPSGPRCRRSDAPSEDLVPRKPAHRAESGSKADFERMFETSGSEPRQEGEQTCPEESTCRIFSDRHPFQAKDRSPREPRHDGKPDRPGKLEKARSADDEKFLFGLKKPDSEKSRSAHTTESDEEDLINPVMSESGSGRQDGPASYDISDQTRDVGLMPVTDSTPVVCMPMSPVSGQVPDVSARGVTVDVERLVALVEQHVDRILLSEKAFQGALGGSALITLKDTSFGGAQVQLIRTQSGWSLKASGLNEDGVQQLRRHSQRLIERFALRGLGDIKIEWETDSSGADSDG